MKKTLAFLIGFIFFFALGEMSLGLFSILRTRNENGVIGKNHKSILIIGNSYTAGPLVQKDQIYSKIVEKNIGHLYNIINFSDYSLNTPLIKEQLNSLIKFNPKIVFLMIGQPNAWNFYGYNQFTNNPSIVNDQKNSFVSIFLKHSRIFSFISYSLYQLKGNKLINQNSKLSDPNFAFHLLKKIRNIDGSIKKDYREFASEEELITFFQTSKEILQKLPGNISLRETRISLALNLKYPSEYYIEDLNQLTCYGKCYNELSERAINLYLFFKVSKGSLVDFAFLNFKQNKNLFIERHLLSNSSEKNELKPNNPLYFFYQKESVIDPSYQQQWMGYLKNQLSFIKSSPVIQKLLTIRNAIELSKTYKQFTSEESFIKDKHELINLFANHPYLIDRSRIYTIGANALRYVGEKDLACLTLYHAIEEDPFNHIYSFKDELDSQFYLCSKKMQLTLQDKLKRLQSLGLIENFSPFYRPPIESIQNWRHHDIAFIVNFFNSMGVKVVLQTYPPLRNSNINKGENDPIREVAKELKVDLIDHFNEILLQYPDMLKRDFMYLQGRYKGSNDDHFSPEGHQIVATRILKYLKESHFIQSP